MKYVTANSRPLKFDSLIFHIHQHSLPSSDLPLHMDLSYPLLFSSLLKRRKKKYFFVSVFVLLGEELDFAIWGRSRTERKKVYSNKIINIWRRVGYSKSVIGAPHAPRHPSDSLSRTFAPYHDKPCSRLISASPINFTFPRFIIVSPRFTTGFFFFFQVLNLPEVRKKVCRSRTTRRRLRL